MFPIKHYYPGFLKHFELAPDRKVLSLAFDDCGEWYRSFVDRIHHALENKEYLPIYRISHGEYIMAVGHKLHRNSGLVETLKHYYGAAMRTLNLRPLFYSGSRDNSFETITKEEIEKARQIYIQGLKHVANHGMLAMTFYLNKGFEEYIESYKIWLKKNSIELNESNYYSFYMVYCLLAGPESFRLFSNRKVVVVSSFTPEKSKGLEKGLREKGCSETHFVHISPSKAIFDKIDLSALPFTPEIVLVAAGVGSANIILQFSKIKCVIIDAGFAVDGIAFPEKRWNRPYCIDDDNFDLGKVNFAPRNVLARAEESGNKFNECKQQ